MQRKGLVFLRVDLNIFYCTGNIWHMFWKNLERFHSETVKMLTTFPEATNQTLHSKSRLNEEFRDIFATEKILGLHQYLFLVCYIKLVICYITNWQFVKSYWIHRRSRGGFRDCTSFLSIIKLCITCTLDLSLCVYTFTTWINMQFSQYFLL